jgi:phospholipid/cholesterol/gamma-HCH transport system permease protein
MQEITSDKASLTISVGSGDELTFEVAGRLDSATVGPLWREALARLGGVKPCRLIVEAEGVEYCDGAGATFFADLSLHVDGNIEIRSLAAEFLPLLELFRTDDLAPVPDVERKTSLPVEVGRNVVAIWNDVRQLLIFTGELTVNSLQVLRHPRSIRWRDALLVAEQAGVNAFPIVALIGFLMGLIMAFQSAIPMAQFGADVFVADLVAITMTKELAPLMTAIILAGRTGSAFAAEIGTMTVNEEINALTTMGIRPVRFLVITRVAATVVTTPILSAFCLVFSLMGGAVVMTTLGFPLVVYVNRLLGTIHLTMLAGSFLKSLVFAIIVAGVGCLRGLQTGRGARSVGESTTRAVVTGIILIIAVDMVFAVVFYALGI